MFPDQFVSSVKGREKDWEVVRKLGSGYYGEVWEIKHGDRTFALKHNISGERTDKDIQQERAIGLKIRYTLWRVFKGKDPVRNHSVAVLPKEKHSRPNPYNDENLRGLFGKNFIVTEPVADGGTLKEFLKQDPRPTDEVLKRIMGCLISGLAIMHAEGIHHHDIHTENILVHNNSPLYNDFGLKTDRQPSNSNGADPAGGETRSAERDVLLLAGALIEILAVLTENDVLTKCKTMRASRSQKLSETDFNRSLRANLTELKQTSQVSGFMDLVLKIRFDMSELPSLAQRRRTKKYFPLED